jgi:hypothetical protein
VAWGEREKMPSVMVAVPKRSEEEALSAKRDFPTAKRVVWI